MTAVAALSPIRFGIKKPHLSPKMQDRKARATALAQTAAKNCYTTPTGRLLAVGSALGAAETHPALSGSGLLWAMVAYGVTRLGTAVYNGVFKRDEKAERQQPDKYSFRALMRDLDENSLESGHEPLAASEETPPFYDHENPPASEE